MTQEIKLQVQEALQEEAYKGIVRIDTQTMRDIGVRAGDIIEIEGGRITVGIVDRAYPTDVGQEIIRMDGILRRNAKTGIGETVKIKKADVKEAKTMTIAPSQEGVMIQADPQLFKRGLLGRAVIKGDLVALGGARRRRRTMTGSPFEDIFEVFEEGFMGNFGFGGLKFMVVDTNPKQPVIITEATTISVSSKAMEVKEESIMDVTYEDIGGLDEEIKKIREMVELPLKHPEIFERLGVEPPKGVLLHGPPGTGKTLLAKAVANESESNFLLINGPEITSKFYGESEKRIREIFEEAEKNAPSIIFIDEIDAIAPKREETYGEVERRIVAQLLATMDGLKSRGKVVVIGATNRPNSLDLALRRPGRFDREIGLGVPTKKGRLNVLKIHTRNMPLTKDVNLIRLSEITHGFVGADLEALCKEAAMNVIRRILPELKLKEETVSQSLLEKLRVTDEDFKAALRIVRPSAMREVLIESPDVKWNDIGGLEELKQELKEAVEWPLKHPEAFSRIGIRPPRGILMYGPPGTGKTLLAKAVATESEANFILVKGPELISKWVGESEKGIRNVFEKARQTAPTIIFFDEIDALASRRGSGSDSGVTDRIINQLLTEMDGLEELTDVVVLAATNRPDLIDPGLLRPGRFDRVLLTPVPSKKERWDILKIHAKSMPLAISKDEIKEWDNQFKEIKLNIVSEMAADKTVTESSIKNKISKEIKFKELSDKDKLLYVLADKTENYVGADLEALCREAAILALREDINVKEIKTKYFNEALKKVKSSIADKDIKKYNEIEEQYLRTARGAAIRETPAYMG